MATEAEIKRFQGYLQEEINGVYYYRTLADLEHDEQLSGIYSKMAQTEERHLQLWRDELAKAGVPARAEGPSRSARLLMWFARRLGPDVVLPVIKAKETGADVVYSAEPRAAEELLPADERQHARIFVAISGRGGLPGSSIGRVETRHRALGGGNALRASVLGANDGLTSNLALVMGVAGADPGHATVVLAGVAGLLAGAFSMALGEWISVTSSREAAQAQIAAEREELERMPEAEREELALIYQAKGLPEAQADELAAHIMADRESALGVLAREELGIVPEELGSPWTAALASFILFAIGALLPVLPFFITGGVTGIVLSATLAGLGLFTLGSAITLLTGRSPWFSGLRQLVLGLVIATITFAIGSAIGGVAGV
ncbi:MAG: VIT1/CCC1 transporter family protein [Dehalococcoidia bacterium]